MRPNYKILLEIIVSYEFTRKDQLVFTAVDPLFENRFTSTLTVG